MNSAWLWSRTWLAINKTQKYFLLPDHQLAVKLILFLVCKKEQKEDKSEFVPKSVVCRNYKKNYFHVKMSLEFLVKLLLHNVFLLITWMKKPWLKQPVDLTQLILASYGYISWKAFKLSQLFLRISGFPDMSGKVLLITFKFS